MKKISVIFTLVLVLLLVGFQGLGAFSVSLPNYFLQYAAQRTREQRIVKSVIILSYTGPGLSEGDYAEALSALSLTLPAWERVQMGLLNGDSSLGLYRAPDDLRTALLAEQADYMVISRAAEGVLKQHNPPDPFLVTAILQHDSPYYSAHTQLLVALQTRTDDRVHRFFWIELAVEALAVLAAWFALRAPPDRADNRSAPQ